MQQEDLLKRIKLLTTLVTVAFVALIVALLVQFGMLAYYHTTLAGLEKNNQQKQAELTELQESIAYLQSDQYIEDLLKKYGK